MISVNPQSKIYLCKTPLEKDYNNQFTFADSTTQLNYFLSKAVVTADDFVYIRKDNKIKVNKSFDEIATCNYLFYKNQGFTNKYYYCFITKMEYASENSTYIYFETDVYQTWYFDIIYNRCFIEREHVNNDTVGIHTIPESVNTGEYLINGTLAKKLANPSDYKYCMCVTEMAVGDPPARTRLYNGLYSALFFLVFETPDEMQKAIRIYDGQLKNKAIIAIFPIPNGIDLGNTTQQLIQDQPPITATYKILPKSDNAQTFDNLTLGKPTSLNGYTPKNKKLLTYPYCYFNLTNNAGITATFKYEDFSTTPRFDLEAAITIGMEMKAVPRNYKNSSSAYNYGIKLAKTPLGSWASDLWNEYMGLVKMKNDYAVITSTASSLVNGTLSALSLNGKGYYNAIQSHFDTVFNAMILRDEYAIAPIQNNGNSNAGDINFSYIGDGGLTAYPMSIRQEYAKIIDDYFSMFGYKVNVVKQPNITGRENWNYVKTINCNFDGNIPEEDLEKIRDMFDSGITLWHNPNNIYRYDLSNNII